MNEQTTEKTLLPGEATQEQIDAWKVQHPEGVHQSIIATDSGKVAIYFKEPDDSDYAMIMDLLANKQLVKAGILAFQTLKIGGFEIPATDKKLYRTACTEATKRINYYETETVKL